VSILLAGAFLFVGGAVAQVGGGGIYLEYEREWNVEGEPSLIAVDPATGDVLVNINNNWRVFRYSATGEVISILGRDGEVPAGLTVDARGYVIVAVNINQNHRIVRYDQAGEVAAEWDGEGNVGGIAIDVEGRSVVAVNINQNHRVAYYGSSGELLPSDDLDWRPGVAVAIAADPAGGAVVAVNINNNCYVDRYSNAGQLLASWQVVAGVIETNGITVGPNGSVFVSINNNHRVVAYSHDGEFLFEFGGEGSGPWEFRFPAGIAAGGGLLYVADSGNHRIQVFGLRT